MQPFLAVLVRWHGGRFMYCSSLFQGEPEKDKAQDATDARPSPTSQSTVPVHGNTPGDATMGNNLVGTIPPYYAAFQYPYHSSGYPAPNGVLPANQMTSPPMAANHQSSAARQSSNASTLRQRSAISSQTFSVSASTSAMSPQPHVTQTSMASLLLAWFLGICILALLARRLFMASWCLLLRVTASSVIPRKTSTCS